MSKPRMAVIAILIVILIIGGGTALTLQRISASS